MPPAKYDSDIVRQLNITDESIRAFIEGRRRRLRPHTLYNYYLDLEFARRNIKKPLLEWDANDVIAFVDLMEKELGHKRSSVKRRLAALSSFFDYHRRAGRISRNPIEEAEDRLPQWERTQGKPIVLSNDEVFEILTYHRSTFRPDATAKHDLIGTRDHSLLITLIFTGIRVHSASQLQTIHFRDIDTDTPYLEILNDKGGKNRDIPLHSVVVDAYKKWLRVRPPFPNHYCYINLRLGNPLSDRSIQQMVKKVAQEAGIQKNITPHKCRHTFATRLLMESKANIKDIQELLGHSSIETTSLYLHSDRERKQKLVNRLAAPEE